MKDVRLYLIHIAECLRRIESYTREGRDAFISSTMAQDAVIRDFEVIGEAAKQIPPEFRCQHPQVPRKRLSGFRDVLIHAYDRVRLDEAWAIVEYDLPDLKDAILGMEARIDRCRRST